MNTIHLHSSFMGGIDECNENLIINCWDATFFRNGIHEFTVAFRGGIFVLRKYSSTIFSQGRISIVPNLIWHALFFHIENKVVLSSLFSNCVRYRKLEQTDKVVQASYNTPTEHNSLQHIQLPLMNIPRRLWMEIFYVNEGSCFFYISVTSHLILIRMLIAFWLDLFFSKGWNWTK